jgi:hypothetical protein
VGTSLTLKPFPEVYSLSYISVPPERVEKIMDQIEKYIMTRLYKHVFCPETTDDEKKDLAIQKRIR